MSRIQNYTEFFPYYLKEHSNLKCRALHFVGTSIGFMCFLRLLTTGNLRWVLLGLFSGYLFAWIGHFIFEKNRPATFKYPWWSFISDWRMWGLMLVGKLWENKDVLVQAGYSSSVEKVPVPDATGAAS